MSSNQPLVSVIIPTHNRSALVLQALRSVQQQTIGDWEAIVVDDASEEDIQLVVNSLDDPRFRYFRTPRNFGAPGARNLGARHAAGEYLAFLDSDDQWLPRKLELDVDLFRRSAPDVGLVYSGMIFRTDDGHERVRLPRCEGWIHAGVRKSNPIGTPSRVVVRRACFESVNGFDQALRSDEDWEFYVRVTERWSVASIPEALVIYREHLESISGSPFRCIEGRMQFWRKCGFDRSSRDLRSFHYARLAHDLSYRGGPPELSVAFFLRAFLIAPWKLQYLFGALVAISGPGAYHRLAFAIHRILHRFLDSARPASLATGERP
jgi:glycosyltransferase involved in cell wall biosynthesis